MLKNGGRNNYIKKRAIILAKTKKNIINNQPKVPTYSKIEDIQFNLDQSLVVRKNDC